LDAHANLIGSWNDNAFHVDMRPGPGFLLAVVRPVEGAGFFGSAPGQVGPSIVFQTNHGGLEFLAYNGHGGYAADDFVDNTIGLPHMVGVMSSSTAPSLP